MQKFIATVCASIVLAMPVVSHAQFGNLGNIGNMLGGNKSSSNSGVDPSMQQEQLARSYVAAGNDVLTANGHMATALGINAQAVNASATSDALSGSHIEAQEKAISANAQLLSEATKSGAILKTAEAKAKYAQGLIALASGVKKYIGMRNDAQGFSSSLSSVSPLQLGKLQTGVHIVKSLPTSISNLSSTLSSAIDFAKKNDVPIPADATSLL